MNVQLAGRPGHIFKPWKFAFFIHRTCGLMITTVVCM